MQDFKLPSGFSWTEYYKDVEANVKSDAGKYDIASSDRASDASDWRFIEHKESDFNSYVVGENGKVIKFCDGVDRSNIDTNASKHAYGVDRSVYESTETYKAMCGEGYQ
jgi:hypothetical protein